MNSFQELENKIIEQRLKRLEILNKSALCKCLRRSSFIYKCECCPEIGKGGCDNIKCHAYDDKYLKECEKCNLFFLCYEWDLSYFYNPNIPFLPSQMDKRSFLF
jgi:hypothetical protein